MHAIEFQNPAYLLMLIPLCAILLFRGAGKTRRRGAAVAVSSEAIVPARASFRTATWPYLPALRYLSLALLVVALARPGQGIDASSITSSGIDIMIVLDVSDSMMGEDFTPKNRLEVAKQAVKDFIRKRSGDRIGMVVFSGEAYLQCPLTLDHRMLPDIVDEAGFTSVEEEGTAIGEAIALAASRMDEGGAKSKMILLVTDGMNNRGSIDPETAARLCAGMGIKIYSVGIGKDGRVPYPGGGIFWGKRYLYNHFDEGVLRSVSGVSGGKFYRATSSGVFWENVRDIDSLEKSDIATRVYHEFSDSFMIFLVIAVGVFFTDIALRSLVYRKVP